MEEPGSRSVGSSLGPLEGPPERGAGRRGGQGEPVGVHGANAVEGDLRPLVEGDGGIRGNGAGEEVQGIVEVGNKEAVENEVDELGERAERVGPLCEVGVVFDGEGKDKGGGEAVEKAVQAADRGMGPGRLEETKMLAELGVVRDPEADGAVAVGAEGRQEAFMGVTGVKEGDGGEVTDVEGEKESVV